MTFDDYFWDNGGTCLKNKLGIYNSVDLDEAVREISLARMQYVRNAFSNGNFSVSHIKALHGLLFCDVYDWAGQYRMCDMERNQKYACAVDIPSEMESYCKNLKRNLVMQDFQTSNDLASSVADSWAALNKIHPFRDGNGRTQFMFFSQLCDEKGFDLVVSKRDLSNLRNARDIASMGRANLLQGILSRSVFKKDDVNAECISERIIGALGK